MIIKEAILETVCGISSSFPKNNFPEIAFAGKSNVGKSSLINALMNRKALARTSSSPGKTQTVNFYRVNGNLYYVDLPGYGYAKVSEEIKAKWGKMIEIRHEPSANDKLMYSWVREQGFKPIIIATKLDKINRSQVPKHIKMLKESLNLEKDTKVFPFSALNKQGKEEIIEEIENLIN